MTSKLPHMTWRIGVEINLYKCILKYEQLAHILVFSFTNWKIILDKQTMNKYVPMQTDYVIALFVGSPVI